MSTTDGNYSAFPVTYDPTGMRVPCTTSDGTPIIEDGMSLRQYAAIHLRVPNSGTDWLDEMIREAQRNEFAGRAMQAMIGSSVHSETFGDFNEGSAQTYAFKACIMADAMRAAGNGGEA